MNKKLQIISAITGIIFLSLLIALYIKTSDSRKKLQAREALLQAEEQVYLEETMAYENFLATNVGFYPNSYLNGEDISGLTVDEIVQNVKTSLENDKILIKTEDGSLEEYIALSEFETDLSDFENYLKKLYNCQTLTREEYLTSAERKEFVYDFKKNMNLDSLKTLPIITLLNKNASPSQNAYAYVDPSTAEVSIVKETFGSQYSVDYIAMKISDAIMTDNREIILSDEGYSIPTVTSDDESLKNLVSRLQAATQKVITINLCGGSVVLEGSDLWKLLAGYDDLVSDAAVKKYIDSLKAVYDTKYSERYFTNSLGERILVPCGNYGWLINVDGTLSKLKEAIASDSNEVTMEVSYSQKSSRPYNAELSDTYIEVSISAQHIWVYQEGNCILEDDVITGEVSTNNPETMTNRGVFKLNYKQLNAVLRGDDYVEPVTYWMPFDGGIGFHDASWRDESEFGGSTYIGNGSHGCVNMKTATASALYDFISEDIPIIVW